VSQRWIRTATRTFLVIGVLAAGYTLLRRRTLRPVYPAPASLIIEPQVDAAVTRRADGRFEITWRGSRAPYRVYAGSHPDAIARDTPLAHADAEGRAIIEGLDLSQRHYFALVFEDHRAVIAAERFLPLPGAINFRDLGGYQTADGLRVKWAQVFRSGSLGALSDAALDQLAALDLNLICDLRTDGEASEDPDRLPGNLRPDGYWHVSLETDEGENRRRARALLLNRSELKTLMREAYTRVMLDRNARLYGEVLRRLSDPDNLPALLHCTAGKDRTGVAVALLLAALGVPDEVIIADYTLSNHFYRSFYEFGEKAIRPLARLNVSADDLYPLLVADAEVMRFALAYVRERYGTIDNYLTGTAGLEPPSIERLRGLLLE
jgi:protein-tyrosine phosphatase